PMRPPARPLTVFRPVEHRRAATRTSRAASRASGPGWPRPRDSGAPASPGTAGDRARTEGARPPPPARRSGRASSRRARSSLPPLEPIEQLADAGPFLPGRLAARQRLHDECGGRAPERAVQQVTDELLLRLLLRSARRVDVG